MSTLPTVPESIDWQAIVREVREHAAFRNAVLARARVHRAEQLASEERGELVTFPRCDVCGERGTDTDQVVDLWDPRAHDYVCVAHFEGGCRDRLPELKSDFDTDLGALHGVIGGLGAVAMLAGLEGQR